MRTLLLFFLLLASTSSAFAKVQTGSVPDARLVETFYCSSLDGAPNSTIRVYAAMVDGQEVTRWIAAVGKLIVVRAETIPDSVIFYRYETWDENGHQLTRLVASKQFNTWLQRDLDRYGGGHVDCQVVVEPTGE
ncbi:MAG: hypothetical protein KC877_03950 [Candidatus Kaiserbacteria bacterium]|nr:hypothetical protein [Candidatus Kaiserbacteria bacterium]MCB9816210.1 hypothetical protein [Candidatus Nomurabacteria bacterium]